MIAYLVELLPVLKAGGAQQILRYSSTSLHTRANGVDWLPRLSVPFRRSMQVFDGAFSAQPQDYASVEVRMQTGDPVSPVIGMAWDGRRCRVWKGAPGQDTAAMQLIFDGDCDSIEATKQGFKVNLRGPGFKLTQNALTSTYGGSGDADGTPDLANTLKPMLLGTAIDVPPTYVDKARGIFQYHAYGAGTMSGVYDGGAPLTYDGNNYADYAALKAANVAGGYYCRCDALGMGRHGGTSITNLAVDASGGAPSGKIGSILTYLAGLAGVPVKADTMTWLDANLVHPQDNFITDQTSYDAICRDMMLKLGGYIWFTADALMSAGLVRRGAAATVFLDRQNIKSLAVQPTGAPYYRRRMGYQRAWKLHSLTDVRTPKEINARGVYVNTSAYAYYDLVGYGTDTWLHIGTDTTTGTVPVEGAVWTKFGAGVTKTSQLTDDANLGLTATWPNVADPNGARPKDYADVTAVNVAASITGQGSLATKGSVAFNSPYVTGFGAIAGQSSVGYGSTYLTGFAALAAQANIWFGSGFLLEQSGGAQATLAAFKTASGIASAIASQGAFATLNSAGYGSSLLTGFGALSPLSAVNFGSAFLLEQAAGAQATLANFKTSAGTAAGFTGQGALATLSSLANGGSYLTGFGSLSSLASIGFGSSYLLETAGGAQATLANFKTSVGTAAGFTGQGFLATQSYVGPSRYQGATRNLIRDPEFYDLAWWTGIVPASGAAAWFPEVGSGNNAPAAAGLARAITLLADAGTVARTARTTRFQLTGGQVLRLRATGINGSNQAMVLTVSAADVAGNSADFGTLIWAANSGTSTKELQLTVPAGKALVDLRVANAGGTQFSGYASVGDIQLAEATTATMIAPQAIAFGSTVWRPDGSVATDAAYYTSSGVASGFSGQGALATQNSLGYGSTYLTGFSTLATMSSISFGSANLLEAPGGAQATLAAFKTSSGTAAGIVGQGALATKGSVDMAGTDVINKSATNLFYNNDINQPVQGLKPAQVGANVTGTNIAAGFTNQGALATKGSVDMATLDVINKSASNLFYNNDASQPVQGLKPAQVGANVTGTNVAAAILNQAPTATSSDFNAVTGSTKPSNNATTDSVFFGQGNNPPIVQGNRITGTSSGNWTGFALSTLGYTKGARMRGNLAPNCMMGLTGYAGVIDAGATYQSISFAVFWDSSNGHFSFFSNGAFIYDMGGGFNENTIWEIVYDGVTSVRVFADGNPTPRYTHNSGVVSGMLRAAVAFQYNGTVLNLTLAPYADVTATNTAAGIAGQGSFATTSNISQANVASYFNFNAFSLNYSITRSDGTTTVTEALAITSLGVSSGFAGQGSLATKSQVGATDIAPSSVQLVTYQVLQAAVNCPVGN
jgi:hypothetical protein